jgi:hypothetical protein
LKWIYSLVVLSVAFPVGQATSGWVALAQGGPSLSGVPFIAQLLLLVLGIYRIYLVTEVPGTLSLPPVTGIPLLLRRVGVFALYVGAVVAVLKWFAGSLMKTLMTQHTESGIEFFVVGLFLSLLSGIGTLGLVFFELSRLIGFEGLDEKIVPD